MGARAKKKKKESERVRREKRVIDINMSSGAILTRGELTT